MPAVSGSGLVHSTQGHVGPVLGAPCTRPDVQTAGHPPPRGGMRFWVSPRPTCLRWGQAQHPWSQPPSSAQNQVPRSPSHVAMTLRPRGARRSRHCRGRRLSPPPPEALEVESLPGSPASRAGKAHPPSRRTSLQALSFPDALPKGRLVREGFDPGVTFDFMGPRFPL